MSIQLTVILDDWDGDPGFRTAWAKMAKGYVQVTADVAMFTSVLGKLSETLERLSPGALGELDPEPDWPEGGRGV